NLSAVPGDRQVSLSWSAVSGATAYQVYQSVGGTAHLEATAATNSFIDTGLTNGTPYGFYVIAVGSSGQSSPSAQVTAVPRAPAAAPHPSLGTNLSELTDYSRELPFVDVFHAARTWIPQQQGAAWGQGPALQLDANGWIQSLQPGQYAETILLDNALDDQAHYPTGQYTLLYDGDGTIDFDLQSATIVSQTAGRMVVAVPAGQNGVFLRVMATNPANPIRNIRFIMPGFEATYQTQPFHPVFLQRLQSFKVLRFMEWMLTNGSNVQNWADRAVPADYTYTRRGVPLEVLIQLAGTANITPWFNIPAKATDDYIRQFATMVSAQLNPSLHFYLEYSNETWNGMFSQNAWIRSQGTSLGFSTDPTLATADYTAWRATGMFSIFQSVFGSSSRMVRVIASQAGNSWLSDQTLAFQNAFATADVLAIAPYFNCDDTAAGGFGVLGDPATATQVAAMTADQVIDIELAHINGCAMQQMQSNAAVARKYGIQLVAYEGGQSLAGYNGAENNAALTAVFKTSNRSPRMAALYAQYLQNWITAGGDMFVHFSDVTAFTKYGSWGALEYQDQDPNTAPKYQALTTFAAQHP
ncbi:MAG: fibronectin type III domain-containing protein, partial [Acidobacteriota bacterium]